MADSPIRRDRHDIIAEILKIAIGGKIKTHIMYRARLSYSQTNTYLSLLVEKGFLENTVVGQEKQYKTTPRGIQFIEILESVDKLWVTSPPTRDESK